MTVTVCRRPDSNRRWLTPALKATDLDHSAIGASPTCNRKKQQYYNATCGSHCKSRALCDQMYAKVHVVTPIAKVHLVTRIAKLHPVTPIAKVHLVGHTVRESTSSCMHKGQI